jgi:hypothetical protein
VARERSKRNGVSAVGACCPPVRGAWAGWYFCSCCRGLRPAPRSGAGGLDNRLPNLKIALDMNID